ncbi:MAG: hypothetical protein KAX65_09875, partial [Caldilineaceae bacterium]|nr:hypothetical protein [Caldilineaceae bacterium]
ERKVGAGALLDLSAPDIDGVNFGERGVARGQKALMAAQHEFTYCAQRRRCVGQERRAQFVPGVTAAPELLGCGVWRTVCTMPNRASSVSSGSKVLRVGMTTCGS